MSAIVCVVSEREANEDAICTIPCGRAAYPDRPKKWPFSNKLTSRCAEGLVAAAEVVSVFDKWRIELGRRLGCA